MLNNYWAYFECLRATKAHNSLLFLLPSPPKIKLFPLLHLQRLLAYDPQPHNTHALDTELINLFSWILFPNHFQVSQRNIFHPLSNGFFFLFSMQRNLPSQMATSTGKTNDSKPKMYQKINKGAKVGTCGPQTNLK